MPVDLLSQHLKLLARGWPMLDYFALPAVLFFVLAGVSPSLFDGGGTVLPPASCASCIR